MGTRLSTWIGGTAVVAVLILLAAWFLLLSPLREDAASVRAQVETTEQQNDLLELQVAGLRADFAKLPEYKAELETLRVGVPRALDSSPLLRELDALAVASGVQLLDVAFMAPVEVVPAGAVAPAAVPTEPVEGAADEAVDGVAPVPAAPAGPTAPRGLVGVDLNLTVSGNPDAVGAFFTGLQDGSSRLLLVTGFDLSRQDAQGASDGQAAVVAGDLRAAVRGTVYVLPSRTAAADPAAAPADGAAADAGGAVSS
ncbi:MAG: hypothetical protein IR158_07490 [Cellulomonas sp.]|jgi:hypothetical protein|uniref:hypothetical protein n=1 Tax=Cellulomonas sp. TaxID=40001 RepID=UPI0019F6A247|nr:hypothetical protein [Cellulomonas sp.]MBF0687597.1 hypothetical protein [Cellulomonas sp.]